MSANDPYRPPAPPAPATEVLGAPTAGPTRPWWQRGWGVAAIGIVALIIGAGIGAAGKGSTKTVTAAASTTTIQAAQTPTRTVTVTRVVVHTHTQTQTAAAAAPSEPSSGGSSQGGGHSYSGDGTKNLGTIIISQPSTLHWKAEGGVFGVTGATSGYEHSIGISSQASSGESAVEPGTYKEVNVIATGAWSITISPG
jgi:hypothetical protein